MKMRIHPSLRAKVAGGDRAAGVSLIEVLIGVAVFLTIAVAMYAALGVLLRSSTNAHARVAGLALANERLEVIRNLSYDAVGTVAGLPQGLIPGTQTIVRDGIPFVVRTTVRDNDDPFDGTIGGSPNDLSPADYKRATVHVECPTCLDPFPPIELTSVISKGLETATGNGALFVQVFDANGNAVQDAAVSVDRTTGGFSVQEVTDQGGFVRLLDVPPAIEEYRIVATKAGYSTDRTYPPGSPGNPNPVKPDATVVAGDVTQVSFAIDRTGTVRVTTVAPGTCAAAGDVALHVDGAKLIGTSPDVRKYAADVVTDSAGALTLSSLEWDTYRSAMTDARFDLAGAVPAQPLTLAPAGSLDLTLLTRLTEPETLLVTVRDASTSNPLNGAGVRIIETNETKTTGEGNANCAPPGQAFFFGIAAGAYTVEVTAGGYPPSTTTVDVSEEATLDVFL